MKKSEPRITPRIRVSRGDLVILGPGKADLLEAIENGGTIRDAAASMGMSYMRAWMLIRTMNEEFTEPLVLTSRGGKQKGTAELSPTGSQVLAIYRQIERETTESIGRSWPRLRKLIRK